MEDRELLMTQMLEAFNAVKGIVLDIETARQVLLDGPWEDAESQLFALATISKNRIAHFAVLFNDFISSCDYDQTAPISDCDDCNNDEEDANDW
jgi:hypothetical protein